MKTDYPEKDLNYHLQAKRELPMYYRVHVDMSKVLEDLKNAGVKSHRKLETILRVKANDPDEACNLATEKIYADIIKEKACVKFQEIAKKAKTVISVTIIRRINS